MSFVFDGCNISLENYSTIFGKLSMDFKDEIRLAILDDTPIGVYLPQLISKNDSAKLAQIRKSLRVYMPPRYIQIGYSAGVLEGLRLLFLDSGEMQLNSLNGYLREDGVQELCDSTLLKIMSILKVGVDISRVNFLNVPESNVQKVLVGLLSGLPVWVFAEGNYSKAQVDLFLKGMSLGVDMHPFLDTRWSTECIEYLLTVAKQVNLVDITDHVNYFFNLSQLQCIVQAYIKQVDFTLLCAKDENGKPRFNEYQMDIIYQALVKGVLTEEIYDYTKSDMDMQELLNYELSS